MMLLKDYATGKKSLTTTNTVISFFFVFLVFAVVIEKNAPIELVWAAIAFHATYQALYWNKRVRAGKDGIEVTNDKEVPDVQ